jgi:hypothetical protein
MGIGSSLHPQHHTRHVIRLRFVPSELPGLAHKPLHLIPIHHDPLHKHSNGHGPVVGVEGNGEKEEGEYLILT